jgi:hypothetical protein
MVRSTDEDVLEDIEEDVKICFISIEPDVIASSE